MNRIFLLVLVLAEFTAFSQDKNKKEDNKKSGNEPEPLIWNLPRELSEISGITFFGKNKIACVQDELGVLFIYDLKKKAIDKQIKFGGNADYEGVAVVDEDAFVLRSDGVIFGIENFNGMNPEFTEYTSALAQGHNTEGFCYDPNNNRILITVKGADPHLPEKKPVYSFDLKEKKVTALPAFAIDMNDPLLGNLLEQATMLRFQPSDIAVLHDSTYLIIDAENKYIYRVSEAGKLISKKILPKQLYPQAEGITIYKEKEVLISNEGKNGKATLVRSNLTDWIDN